MEFEGAPGKISLRLVSWDIHSLIHMDYGYYAYVPLHCHINMNEVF